MEYDITVEPELRLPFRPNKTRLNRTNFLRDTKLYIGHQFRVQSKPGRGQSLEMQQMSDASRRLSEHTSSRRQYLVSSRTQSSLLKILHTYILVHDRHSRLPYFQTKIPTIRGMEPQCNSCNLPELAGAIERQLLVAAEVGPKKPQKEVPQKEVLGRTVITRCFSFCLQHCSRNVIK